MFNQREAMKMWTIVLQKCFDGSLYQHGDIHACDCDSKSKCMKTLSPYVCYLLEFRRLINVY